MNLPAAASATYNAGNQLTGWNGASIPSDQANNLSTDPTLPIPGSITWDERNHLASVNAQGTQNFLYDALGRRESESGSIPTATFLLDGVTPVRTTIGSANADLLAMPGTGEVFTRTDSSGIMVPLHDAMGSTIGLVNSTGTIATRYTYQPFGRSTASGAANANPFQFAGMESDSSGLYHTWARYYSPGVQRFLSEDPLGFGGGDTNIFACVHNNPVNGIDPFGLSAGSGAGGGGGPPTNVPPGGGNKRNGGVTESTSTLGDPGEIYAPPDVPGMEISGATLGGAAGIVSLLSHLEVQRALVHAGVPVPLVEFLAVFGNEAEFVALGITIGFFLGGPIGATVLGLAGAGYGAFETGQQAAALEATSTAP